ETPLVHLARVPKATAHLTLPDGRRHPVPATLVASGSRYAIRLQADPALLPARGEVRIDVSFDTFFLPRELELNDDTRQLVVHTPPAVRLSRRAVAGR